MKKVDPPIFDPPVQKYLDPPEQKSLKYLFPLLGFILRLSALFKTFQLKKSFLLVITSYYYLIQNSLAVKKGCGPKKAIVKKAR